MSVLTLRKAAASAVVVLMGATLAGCGDDGTVADPTSTSSTTESATTQPTTESPSTDSSSPATKTEPVCSEAIVAGQPLAADYAGCYDDEADVWLKPRSRKCSSGGTITVLGPKAYVVAGQPVIVTKKILVKDKKFLELAATCSA